MADFSLIADHSMGISSPRGVAIAPGNASFALVINWGGSSSMAKIDLISGAVTLLPDLNLSNACGVSIAPDGLFALVAEGHHRIARVDLHSHAVTYITDPGLTWLWDVAIAPDGAFALAANGDASNVARIDLSSNAVTYIKDDNLSTPY